MFFTKKRRYKPLYKKFLRLKKNIQNRKKLLRFKKKKWQVLRYSILKYKKKLNYLKFNDSSQYFLSNFNTFFSNRFLYNLLNKQRLSLYYGGLGKNYLKRMVKEAQLDSKNTNKHISLLFIEKLERRLDTTLYHSHFVYSLRCAKQLISHQKVSVNGKIVKSSSYKLKKGDFITINKTSFNFVVSNVINSDLWPLPPKHLCVNYKILQITVIEDMRFTNFSTKYPSWIDFNSFIKFYER
jgi:ribosomal protein S4